MLRHHSTEIRWLDDVGPARWWTARLDDSYDRVSALLPAGYQSYFRLFHPVQQVGAQSNLRWSDVARLNGRVVHARMQFRAIRYPPEGRPQGIDPRAMPAIRLPVHHAQLLIQVLQEHTTTVDRCLFGVVDRYLEVDDQKVAERVTLPSGGANYLLHSGPLAMAVAAPPAQPLDLAASAAPGTTRLPVEAATLWWPEDRAWFVATDLYLGSTYIAGTGRLLAQLLAHSELEVLEAALTDSLLATSDTVNC